MLGIVGALLCGSLNAVAFHVLYDILPANPQFCGWYFYSFPNDHYSPLTVFVHLAYVAVLTEAWEAWERWRVGGGRRCSACTEAVQWVVGLLLASVGQVMIVTNVLQRTV